MDACCEMRPEKPSVVSESRSAWWRELHRFLYRSSTRCYNTPGRKQSTRRRSVRGWWRVDGVGAGGSVIRAMIRPLLPYSTASRPCGACGLFIDDRDVYVHDLCRPTDGDAVFMV